MLSVVAMQIITIQKAMDAKVIMLIPKGQSLQKLLLQPKCKGGKFCLPFKYLANLVAIVMLYNEILLINSFLSGQMQIKVFID